MMNNQTALQMIADGCLVVINHSAGKDSQAMAIKLREIVPADQLLVIHADLGEVEWPGNVEHIEETIGGLPLMVCRNENKTFFDMVEHRGKWPSASHRQCTSDLKRGPIEREIRRYLKINPRFKNQVLNCMGIRAEESPTRSRQQPFKLSKRNSKAGRAWCDWLPIFELSKADVFQTIAQAGQRPHWAYAEGMTRLSCSFCIMASKCDLQNAARLRPGLYRKVVETEKRIGHTFSMSQKPLEEITGIAA